LFEMLVLVFLIYNIRSRAPVTIAVNSTGVKVHKAGGWVERKHGKKSRYEAPLRRKHRDP